jgi:hypothetical protein
MFSASRPSVLLAALPAGLSLALAALLLALLRPARS